MYKFLEHRFCGVRRSAVAVRQPDTLKNGKVSGWRTATADRLTPQKTLKFKTWEISRFAKFFFDTKQLVVFRHPV